MDWSQFFLDLQNWMGQSNQMTQKHPVTSDAYWAWLVQSLGELGNKYNNHPLALGFLDAIIKFQEKNYDEVTGRS